VVPSDKIVAEAMQIVEQMPAEQREEFFTKLKIAKPDAEPKRYRAKKATFDPIVIKQAGAFHIELMGWLGDFRERVKAWHVANPNLDEESKSCLMQALEFSAMGLWELNQALDGR
jgi:hypothetical protein